MRPTLLMLAISAGISLTSMAQAQAPVTATCKDGTAFSGTSRSGACRGHGGVQAFNAATAPAAVPAAAVPSSATPPQTAGTTQLAPATTAPQPAFPPSRGAGQVWVNTTSRVYHCSGDRYYGKTKAGTYMTEAAAKAAGDRPDHGKACS